MSNIQALMAYLVPFEPFFAMAQVSEICINRPYEVWVEHGEKFECFAAPDFSFRFLMEFAGLVAEYNNREISAEYPTLSSILPDGSRIQFVIAPACAANSFICSIRRQSIFSIADVDIDAYLQNDDSDQQAGVRDKLITLYKENNYVAFLKAAVMAKKNIIIAGGTSTGKTTFLNALLKYIPAHERIITIETDREVQPLHKNVVHLLATQEGKSVATISMLDLLKASLRLRPDRILVSELRADEAFPYLRAINSGHPGSITTLHANSPEGCFDQLVFMALQSGVCLTRDELILYAKSIINVVVQIEKNARGQRYIARIYFDDMEAETEKQVDTKRIKKIEKTKKINETNEINKINKIKEIKTLDKVIKWRTSANE